MLNRFVLALALMIAGCQSGSQEPPPLAGARIGGPFTLIDQNGKPKSDRDFAGKYRIMYFGYTYCPDVCPTDMAKLAAGYRAFTKRDAAAAARVVPVFVTVDPERDTPAVVKQFAAAFDRRVVGLTGTPEQIAGITKAYGVVYGKAEGGDGANYLVDHSRQAYLMGPKGEPIALLSNEGSADAIADELVRWVR